MRITVIEKIVSVSPARVILSANRAEAEAQGYERKDIAGRPGGRPCIGMPSKDEGPFFGNGRRQVSSINILTFGVKDER